MNINTTSRLSRGFTMIELLIGLVVCSFVLLALTGLVLAVSAGWRTTDSTQSAFLSANAAVTRILQQLQPASALGICQTGSTDGSAQPAGGIIYWTDANADDQIELGEVAVILHDPAAQELDLYTVPPALASQVVPDTTLTSATAISAFLALASVKTPLAHNIIGAQFQIPALATSDRPTVEFVLNVQSSAGAELTYGSATFRCARTLP